MNATFRVSGYQVPFVFCCVHWITWSILLIKKKNPWLLSVSPPACKICYGMVLDMIVIIYVMLISIFATTTRVLTSKCEEMRFYLHSYGHLTNNNSEVLFTGEDTSRGKAIIKCFNYCRGDRRCIGMEVCKIAEDLPSLLCLDDYKQRTVYCILELHLYANGNI